MASFSNILNPLLNKNIEKEQAISPVSVAIVRERATADSRLEFYSRVLTNKKYDESGFYATPYHMSFPEPFLKPE